MVTIGGFEEVADYKLPSSPDKAKTHLVSSLMGLTRAGSNPVDLSSKGTANTPGLAHLKAEIRFYNDTLLVISILTEMYQALIEELKLPSSIKVLG